MQTLDSHAIPLESINLIEASAGTGKSWTVTLLYLRLILEKDLTVDQILVVTFTEAATKELRDDIRNRLVDALAAFEIATSGVSDNQKDDEYLPLIRNSSDLEQSIRQLNRAKLSLDEAAILTIHSFCQRALSEYSFEAGLPFDSELMDDDTELMQKLTDDFWRRNFYQAPQALLFKLQQKSITPDSLLQDIRLAVGKPYLTLCKPEEQLSSTQKWLELETVFKEATQVWRENEDEIVRLINDPDFDDGFLVAFKNARELLINELSIMAASDYLPSVVDSKLAWLGTRKKTKAKFEEVEHAFFGKWQNFLNLWSELDETAEHTINQIRVDLLEYLQQELPKEKRRLGVLSFDDLLLQLQQSLHNNPELSKDLFHKYPAALIDEFQDTDPIQYDIFSTIYKNRPETAVFLVGDPKQAVYSFRGGDIHTYLNAKKTVLNDNRYTLKKNWRSHPKLVSAFNALYMAAGNPFYDTGIDYIEIESGDTVNEDLITPANRSHLNFWQVPLNDEKPSITQIRQQIADAVAGDITETLNAALSGKANIGDDPISGGDIAVLVRSHSQANLIKSALNAKGVASVQSSKENIFQTHEAAELLSLLAVLVDPQQEDNIRRALVTDLMGHSAADLQGFEVDSHSWEEKLLAIQNWQYQWKQRGFLPMMRVLMQDEKVHQRLMNFVDGERRLTNTLHLAEIVHQQSKEQSLGMKETLRWLKYQQQSHISHEAELRLESDEQLVKIVTIHKSKGLEYPIVYCPFIGLSGKSNTDKIFTFHKDERTFLEIGSSDFNDHKGIKAEEEKAEDARLLYVALTRAKYQCNVVCVPEQISGAPDKTALGWLITDGTEKLSGSSKAAKESVVNYHDTYAENLQNLADRNPNIGLQDLPEFEDALHYQSPDNNQALNARIFSAEIKSQAVITSFSRLTAGAHDESPDHDATTTHDITLPAITDAEFPRGPTAGNTLHEIYENLDFTVPVTEQVETLSTALNKWGFDEKLVEVATVLMERSLQTELFDGFALNQLNHEQRLNEMEFYLPLEHLKIETLQQILFEHLPEDWQVVRDAVSTLSFDQVEGYLKGYIDLIFEHDGLYYVVDYKSNTLIDYSPESLLSTMSSAHYYLQSLLYSVALHRYLQKRHSDYHWETHMGGAYYLFIRGMGEGAENNTEVNATPNNGDISVSGRFNNQNEECIKKGGGVYKASSAGIFFDKPSLALIEALDSLFMESLL